MLAGDLSVEISEQLWDLYIVNSGGFDSEIVSSLIKYWYNTRVWKSKGPRKRNQVHFDLNDISCTFTQHASTHNFDVNIYLPSKFGF